MSEYKQIKPKASLLQRLRKDASGNVLAMSAMAMFPLIGLVGGGVDIGRAYMAKARLQQACDAGALAGRRNMISNKMSANDKAEAKKFFSFNFPDGSFDSTPFDATVLNDDKTVFSQNKLIFKDGSSDRVVNGEAQTTIQTALMKIFDIPHMLVKAECSSRLDVGNVDVMMVLDVTGSMGGGVSDGGTRLGALQDAVEDFYKILGPGGGVSGEQIRYGFVPYSSTVNVGKILYDANPNWLVGGKANERYKYQTRRSKWTVTSTELGTPKSSNKNNPVVTYQSKDSLDGMECLNNYGNLNTATFDNYLNPNPAGNPTMSQTESSTTITIVTTTYSFYKWGNSTATPPASATGSANYKTCQRKVSVVTEVYDKPTDVEVDVWQPGATSIQGWEYGYFDHDVSAYVRSIDLSKDAAQLPTENGLASDRWQGCIEERNTNSGIVATTTSIPSDALDLDIDLVPTNDASRWSPMWPKVVYDRSNSSNGWQVSQSGDNAACPSAAKKLQSYASFDDGTSNSLKSYIDSFQARGYTNHTIGMIWGARLLSATGLFGTENSYVPNKFKIGRHMVFMTDGAMVINNSNYDAYGFPKLDSRIAPANSGDSELKKRQEQRFQLVCQRARNQGWTIWVIQFGVSSVSTNMKNCSSGPEYAAPANNKAELKAAFSTIAQKIGGLRLSE